MGVSCKDLAIGAAFQIYTKIIRKDEECLTKGEEGLEESLNVWAVRAEFPKHGTDEFKKTRKKYLVSISVSPARLHYLET